jgi:DNA-binding protein H-NS
MASSKINLDELTPAELEKLISDATATLETKKEAARHTFLAEMTEKAAAIGLDLSTLFTSPAPRKSGRKPRSDAGKRAAVKYRGPNGEEWSGRGRRPNWVTEAMKGDKKLEDFAV